VWAEDPHFDLDYHLRWVRGPRGGSLEALLQLSAALAMQGFDRARPLWEFVVVEDFDGERAALIQKLHHAVTDGVGGMLLMQRVYDQTADPAPTKDVPPLAERPTARPREDGMLRLAAEAVTRRLVNAPGLARQRVSNAVHLARHPLETLRETSEAFRSLAPMFTPALRPVSPLMQARSTRYRFEVLRMPLSELKSAAHSAGCKLNDAYLCGITGGWRRYHAHHGASVESLRAMIPMDLRGSDSGTVAGNRLSLARFSLPIQDEDAGQRMRRIREILGGQRKRPPAAWVETTAGLLNLLPAAVFTATFGIMARSIDFIASCVLGPREPLYVAGARVEAILPFGPTAGAAANFTLFSYAGEVAVTINVDTASVPDPHRLRDCMTESFDEVLKLGRVTGPSLVPAASQLRNDLRNA
jgi:WS/DGAT/MGAT family acyltransferase